MNKFYNLFKKLTAKKAENQSWYVCTWYISAGTHTNPSNKEKLFSTKYDCPIELANIIFADLDYLSRAPNGIIGLFAHVTGLVAEVKKYPKYLYRYK